MSDEEKVTVKLSFPELAEAAARYAAEKIGRPVAHKAPGNRANLIVSFDHVEAEITLVLAPVTDGICNLPSPGQPYVRCALPAGHDGHHKGYYESNCMRLNDGLSEHHWPQ
jgi:hypothetical protein